MDNRTYHLEFTKEVADLTERAEAELKIAHMDVNQAEASRSRPMPDHKSNEWQTDPLLAAKQHRERCDAVNLKRLLSMLPNNEGTGQ